MDEFSKYAIAWKPPSTMQGQCLKGDEIEVGALWEDKSQKDFKSYL